MSETLIKRKVRPTKTLARPEFEDGDHMTKVAPEKDETEEKLERLLFGDDAGFHEALKSHRTPGAMDLVLRDDSDEEEGEGEDEGGLDDVSDADVSGFVNFSMSERACVLMTIAFLLGFRHG